MTQNYLPTLMLHGKVDVDVPFEQSLEMAKVLKQNKVSRCLITDDSRGYMFDGPEQTPKLKVVFDGVVDFLVEHGTR